jgi:hypothetical protein
MYKFSPYLTGSTIHLRCVARNSDHYTTEAATIHYISFNQIEDGRILPCREIIVISKNTKWRTTRRIKIDPKNNKSVVTVTIFRNIIVIST